MKKGELTIQWIVIAIIAILFLVILILVYQGQLGRLVDGFSGLISNVIGTADEANLQNAIQN